MMNQYNVDLNKYMRIPRSKKTFWLSFIYAALLYIFYMVIVGILGNMLNRGLPILAFTGTALLLVALAIQYWFWVTTKFYVKEDSVIVINKMGMKKSPLEENDEFMVRTNLIGRFFNSGDYILNNPFAGVKFRLNDIHDPYGTLAEINKRFYSGNTQGQKKSPVATSTKRPTISD